VQAAQVKFNNRQVSAACHKCPCWAKFMNIIKNKCLTLSAKKAGKGERFHLKPVCCPHWDSFSQLRWQENETYNCKNFLLPTKIQIFWLWFYVELNIIGEKQSEMKMVNYNATHYAMIDEQLGAGK
jgi:hypothetical protein